MQLQIQKDLEQEFTDWLKTVPPELAHREEPELLLLVFFAERLYRRAEA